MSSSKIFWMMNVATVWLNSLPLSMIRRQRGMISVCSKKLITSASSICKAKKRDGKYMSWSIRFEVKNDLHESPNHTQTCQPQVLILPVRAHSIQKGIQKKPQVRIEKQAAGVLVRSYALQKRKCVATSIRRSRRQAGRREKRINRNDFLQ